MNVVVLLVAVVLVPAAKTLDLTYLNTSIDPCEDFYEFSCGNFKNKHARPPDEDYEDLFSITQRDLIRLGNEILSSPKRAKDPVALKKAKSAYAACVNVEILDLYTYYQDREASLVGEYGGFPLVDDVEVVKLNFTQVAEIGARNGIQHFFQSKVNYFGADEYILLVMPDTLSAPQMIRPQLSKSYDDILDDSFRRMAMRHLDAGGVHNEPIDVLLEEIARHIFNPENRALLASEQLAFDQKIDQVKEFLEKLFSLKVAEDKQTTLPQITTLKQLQQWTSAQFGDALDVNWVDYFNVYFKQSGFNVSDDFVVFIPFPQTFEDVLQLIKSTDPSVVKNAIVLRSFVYLAPDSDATIRESFKNYYKAVGGKFYNRWEYCTRKILDVVDTASLSFAVVNDFANYHFNINKIPKVVEMLSDLRSAFKSAVSSTEWVDPQSRDLILKKLDNREVWLAYPDFVDNKTDLDLFYSNVRICEADNYGNSQRIRAFKQAYAFSQYVDHDVWSKSPFDINAYATQALNRITVPFAILHDNFYKSDDAILDYGRLGATLAHEAVHHFDDGGIKYDPDGTQTSNSSWLGESVIKTFKEKTQCLEEQYNSYFVPELGMNLNGSQTLSENIADNGGIRHAFMAFEKLLEKEEIESQEGYSARQLFFISYATGWCSLESEDYLKRLVEGDSHAPARFRVRGALSNLKEFAEAFQCPVGSAMNLERKCVLW